MDADEGKELECWADAVSTDVEGLEAERSETANSESHLSPSSNIPSYLQHTQ